MSTNEYCRLCSKRNLPKINIFGEQGKRHLLPFKILHFANVFIVETDPLPKFVCILCIGKLDFILNFRTQCQNAQTFFKTNLREIQLKSESDDVINVESKFKNNDCEISDENAGTSVIDADTGCSNSENSNDTSNKEKESCNKKVTLILKYHEELSEEVGVKMEVEEVDDNEDDFENSENTNINSAKEDQKSCIIIDEGTEIMLSKPNDITNHNLESITAENEKMFVSEKQKLVDNKSNTTQNENSMGLKVSDCESENDDYDYSNDDTHHPVTNVSSAEADKNEHLISDSDGTKESHKLDKFSDDKEPSALVANAKLSGVKQNKKKTKIKKGKANCTKKDKRIKIRTIKVNKRTPVVINPKVKEDLHDPDDNFYFSQSENERLIQAGELFQQSYPRYFECINYIINRKCSLMPYFIKATTQNRSTRRYMFKCFVCKHQIYKDHSGIIKHLIIHLRTVCTFCNYTSRSKARLKQHINKLHYMQLIQEKIRCNYCDEKFSDFDLSWSHMKTHVDEHCGLCEFKSNDPDLLHQHTIHNHKNAKATCTNCAMFYNNGFIDHLKHIKKLDFVCSSCEMVFHNEQHLNMHYKIYGKHHGSDEKIENSSSTSTDNSQKILDMDFSKRCDAKMIKLFQNIVQRKITRKQFEGSGKSGPPICPWPRCRTPLPEPEEKFIRHAKNHLLCACYECNKCFIESNRYKKHVRRVCKKTDFKCCICKNRTIQGLDEYVSHVRDHQAGRVCEYCDAVLSSCRNEKRKHMRQLHNELITKRSFCEICGKSLTRSALRVHLARVHNLEEPSKLCSFCGNFVKYSHKHKCKPNDEKEEFICAYCSKVFNRKTSLRTHIFVHMNEKSFSCSLCNKKFNRESSLSKHVKDMHALRKWTCDFEDCTKAFSFESALKKHITTSH